MTQKGNFRRHLYIQQQIPTKDSTGSVVPTWKTIWSAVPCSVEAWRGQEVFQAQQVQEKTTWKVTFNWRPNLDASMRCIEYTNQQRTEYLIYNIEAVMPDVTNRREIQLMCTTRLEDGFRSDGS